MGLRAGPDTVMARHYWFSASEQCGVLKDEQGCRILRMQEDWRRQSVRPSGAMTGPRPPKKAQKRLRLVRLTPLLASLWLRHVSWAPWRGTPRR